MKKTRNEIDKPLTQREWQLIAVALIGALLLALLLETILGGPR